MNYFHLINAFYERLEIRPLRPPVIALWHALANIANKAGWPATFTVPIKVLSMKAGINEKAVERARNVLMQTGYITWKSRGGSAAAVYTLINLCNKPIYKPAAQSAQQTSLQSVPQNVPQSVDIIKQELKQKLELNIKTDENNVYLFCEELEEILAAVQPESLQPEYWRENIEEHITAMYNAHSIWVNKQRVPQQSVRERLRMLHTDNVQWAIDQLHSAGEVANPRAYMYVVLYNAPVDYDTAMNIEIARKYS